MEPVEKIDPTPPPPWGDPVFQDIQANLDPEVAKQRASVMMSDPSRVIFSDGSCINNKVGAAAVILDTNGNIHRTSQAGVGSSEDWSSYHAELIAIREAIKLAIMEQLQKNDTEGHEPRTYTILSDVKAAIQRIANTSKNSCQEIVNQIGQLVKYARQRLLMSLRLQWIPGHDNIPGNETADKLAKEAVHLPVSHNFHKPLNLRRTYNRKVVLKHWTSQWLLAANGNHLRTIDTALPDKHARQLYNSLNRTRSNILAQLRTGHSWLSSYGKRMKKTENDKCECGARETTVHVLAHCPKLRSAREKLRKRIGKRFNSVSLMLGGKPYYSHPKSKKWKISKRDLDAVLDFAEESQGFISRVAINPNTSTPSSQSTAEYATRVIPSSY
jgi:ribonuclease HI